ncbi:hypothetical protein V5799_034112 [Amblyomma americanum]|uniref:Uncharacterized protein n=1 Tax=Amblyomma americanum TaxID=6943 RepID=A0AAQ4DLE1_AMBAM
MKPLLAYVLYKDGEKAVVPVSLIKDYCPKSTKDTKDLAKNKLVYWRNKDAPDGGEDFYPGDIEELADIYNAATAEELAKKLIKLRIRWPKHVLTIKLLMKLLSKVLSRLRARRKRPKKKKAFYKKLRFEAEESCSSDEELIEKGALDAKQKQRKNYKGK